jgi:nicotinate-nucleotide adenylyltransferase
MCQLAVAGDDFFQVDDLELNRPAPSYTMDTVRQLKAKGFSEINWLIGADMVNSLPRWHDPAGLLAECRFVLMARPGWSMDWSLLPESMRGLAANVVQVPQMDISSTMIRDRLAKGQSIRYLTPNTVVDYIHRRHLFSS